MSAYKRASFLWRGFCSLLVLVCILSLVPLRAVAADDVDVFYGDSSANDNKVVVVQVASSSSLKNCKTCVGRLRDAGYNAYIFQEKKDTTSYRLVIGAYGSKSAANGLLEEVRNGPAVKGVKMDHAYLTNAYISDWGKSVYSDPYYGGSKSTSSSSSSSSSSTKKSTGVDVFYGNDSANDNKVVAVQVASSSSLDNCKTCVGRLRDAGYNAYIFQEKKGATSYRLLIGAYGSKNSANGLLEEIRTGPAVKGVKMDHAYLTNAYLSDSGKATYSDPYYNASKSSGSSSSSSTGSGALDKDLADCKMVRSTDKGGKDIMTGNWKDNFGTTHKNSLKFWVRDGGGYTDTESVVYHIDKKNYTTLSGCVVASDKNDSGAKCEVYIYVDGECEYYSGLIGSKTSADYFEIGVTPGCDVEVECTTDSNAFGHCIVAATLHG